MAQQQPMKQARLGLNLKLSEQNRNYFFFAPTHTTQKTFLHMDRSKYMTLLTLARICPMKYMAGVVTGCLKSDTGNTTLTNWNSSSYDGEKITRQSSHHWWHLQLKTSLPTPGDTYNWRQVFPPRRQVFPPQVTLTTEKEGGCVLLRVQFLYSAVRSCRKMEDVCSVSSLASLNSGLGEKNNNKNTILHQCITSWTISYLTNLSKIAMFFGMGSLPRRMQ